MSYIDLEEAKRYLDVIHSGDDVKLQMLLDAAEDEALQFIDRKSFEELCECSSESSSSSSSEYIMPPSLKMGCLVLLEANYQASPTDREQLRNVAETFLFPFRCNLGV